ncbi:MAG: prolyl oligopeptidase family serine peptidase [Acidimicrobiales bacterium]
MSEPAPSFPRQSARTRGFTLGAPRGFRVAADGSRVVFARSPAGDDPANGLWVLDLASGVERLVADPRAMVAGDEDLPPAERARRERAREVGGGIVAFDTDPSCTRAVTVLGGRLFVVDLVGDDGVGPLVSRPGAVDPRLAPVGHRVAYVAGPALCVTGPDGDDRPLVEPDSPDVSWGSAEFVAAEEMGRTRGHWWAPDGRRLAVARVDVATVDRWYLADPTEPGHEPVAVRYPAAGTPNARVGLAVVTLDGTATPVAWDDEALPYLAAVSWTEDGLVLVVQSRDQRRVEVLVADPETGATTRRLVQEDPVWVDLVGGVPAWLDGRLVTTTDADDTRRVALDGRPATPPGLHVRRVAHAGEGWVWFTASGDDPTTVHVHRVSGDGVLEQVSAGDGVHEVLALGADVVVVATATTDTDETIVEVRRHGAVVATVVSRADTPLVRPAPAFAVVGERRLRSAVLFPAGGEAPSWPLPVLLDPYGGPHVQRVRRARGAFLSSQWLADQGFTVVVVDGRGTPGRGRAWERAVWGDLAGPVLDDQVDALHALAAADDRLDLGRVAIRGWSFGGYLAALAVLRRPDIFHAAVAGAPVTDWALYDTHYTERYLGMPAEHTEAYERSSLLADAARLERPLLLVHGLADDNVVAAHTLRLSRALVEAGRPHSVLPLPGVTHMTTREDVAENLLRLQVAFLRQALGIG